MNPKDISALLPYLTPAEREELDALVAADLAEVAWRPLPGPQEMAYNSTADVIGFGGAAGGGKTDLACGKALTQHRVVQMFRREGTELTAIIDRMAEIVGNRNGLGGKPPVWREPGINNCRLIEFLSVPNLGDEKKAQGRAKDLLVIDEAANHLERVVRFLMGWVRSTAPGQRCQTLLTFNPPTDPEGRWVVSFFAPWIDKKFPGKKAIPGEIRYVAVLPSDTGVSRDMWVEDGRQFVIVDGKPVYDFDPAAFTPQQIITPQSRTFIPSKITDNPYLANTGYMSVLQSLPEPLRSQMLLGDFEAGMADDPWQVIPTAWVEAAMARWKERTPRGEMLSLGCDVARGGKDNTVIATRHKTPETNWWFDKLKLHPGKDTPNGQTVAGLVIGEARDRSPLHIDVIGVGASPYDILNTAGQPVFGVNVSERALGTDKSGKLTFLNRRSELWWRVREGLDPSNDQGWCLPPDPDLLVELCSPKWSMSGMTIKVQSREEIVEDTGRSPDRATAIVLAAIDTPKLHMLRNTEAQHDVVAYDPMGAMR